MKGGLEGTGLTPSERGALYQRFYGLTPPGSKAEALQLGAHLILLYFPLVCQTYSSTKTEFSDSIIRFCQTNKVLIFRSREIALERHGLEGVHVL